MTEIVWPAAAQAVVTVICIRTAWNDAEVLAAVIDGQNLGLLEDLHELCRVVFETAGNAKITGAALHHQNDRPLELLRLGQLDEAIGVARSYPPVFLDSSVQTGERPATPVAE